MDERDGQGGRGSGPAREQAGADARAEARSDARPGRAGATVVVGVVPGQSERVPLAAAHFAERLGAELICAHVDAMRYVVQENADGTITSLPIDPDTDDEGEERFDEEFGAYLGELFAGRPLRWSTRSLAGEPAGALSHLAEKVGAEAIVVGTRHAGFRAGLQEFFGGSVAVHLVHRQARPVIVIPVSGDTDPDATPQLPWEV